MRIRKKNQYIESGASLSNTYGTSNENGYTQNYLNNEFNKINNRINGKVELGTDFNKLLDFGFYFVDTNYSNRPDNSDYGVLLVFPTSSGNWEYVIQLYINNYELNNKRIAVRTHLDNHTSTSYWSGWYYL